MFVNVLIPAPIKSRCKEPEAGTMTQAASLANFPFAFHHVAIMPDTHRGCEMLIAGALATEDVIIPNAVGVDIDCGMCASRMINLSLKTSCKRGVVHGQPDLAGVGERQWVAWYNGRRKPLDRDPGRRNWPHLGHDPFGEPTLWKEG